MSQAWNEVKCSSSGCFLQNKCGIGERRSYLLKFFVFFELHVVNVVGLIGTSVYSKYASFSINHFSSHFLIIWSNIAIWDVCKSVSTFFIFATYLFTFHLAYGINHDDDRNNNNDDDDDDDDNNNNKERQGQETWERRGTWVPTFYGEII